MLVTREAAFGLPLLFSGITLPRTKVCKVLEGKEIAWYLVLIGGFCWQFFEVKGYFHFSEWRVINRQMDVIDFNAT